MPAAVDLPQPDLLEPSSFGASSAAALRLALAASAELVIELARDGSLVDVNDGACALLGRDRGELIGQPFSAIDAEATPQHIARMFDELAAGHRWRADARYRTATGALLPVDVVAQRIELDGREHCFLFAREVVERKRVEAALAESAERFRSLFEDSPVAELLLDANFRIVQVNRAACALLGFASAELIGRDPAQLLHPDEVDAGLRLRTHLARGAVVSAESDRRLVRSDGRTLWVRLAVRAWTAGEGPRRYVLVLEDYTERRAAAEQIEQALARSRTLLETMPVGVAQALDGRVLLANREFARLFGYGEAETTGLPLEELTRDRADRLPHEVSMLPQPRSGEAAHAEVALFRKDGTPIWCLVQARLVDADDAARERGDAIYTFLDVSEQRRSREALGQSLAELNVVQDTAAAAVLHLVDGRVVRGNAQAVMLFDGAEAGPVGSRFEDLFEDANVLGTDWRARLAQLGPDASRTFEARLRGDGRAFLALVSLRAVDAARPADAQVASILDISERRRQELQLESLATESQLLFDTAVVGLLFVRDGKPVRANAAMEEMIGCERGALPRGGELFAHPADSLLMSSLAEHYGEIDRRGACDFEMRLYRRNGNPTWVAVQGRAVDARAAGAGYIFAFVDIDARKRSEAHLRDALAELQRIFDNALVGVAYAANDTLVKANSATAQMFGYGAEELKQRAIGTLFVQPGAWDEVRAHAALAGEANFECELARADGGTFWAAGNARLLDAAAPERGMIVALMNVDARKRSEEELQRVRNYLDLIVENLPVLVAVREADTGRFVSLNRAGEAIAGRPRREVIGRTWHELYDAALAAKFDALDRAALDRGILIDRPREMLPRADGRTLTVHQRVMPLFEDGIDADGRAAGVRARYVMSIIDDLTDTVRTEAALRETDARFRQLAENIDQLVFIATDDLARVLYVSPRYETLVGAPVAELLDDARSIYRHVHAPDRPELNRRMPRLIASMRRGRRAEVTVRIGHPQHGARTLYARLSPVRMFDGSIRVFGIAEDITERIAAEARRLDEALRQRDLLVREVHHRIKNNLQGVAGLLQHQATAKPELAENLHEIAGQIQAIAQVHGLQLRATGTLPMLGVAQGIFSNIGAMFGVTVNFEAPAATLWRWGLPENEAVPLALVINELGTNAIKHRGSREQGVAVRMLPRADGIELRIENPGRLKEGFDLARISSGVSGLGLVKALLPRRGARLSIEQLGPLVISRLVLGPPALREEVT